MTNDIYRIRANRGAWDIEARLNGQNTGYWTVGLDELRKFVQRFRAMGARRSISS